MSDTELEVKEKELEDQLEEAAAEEKAKAEKEGLSEEQVNKRVEAARKQEKDKLYGEIVELKGLVKELRESAKAEEEEKKEIKEETKAKLEAERIAKLSVEEKTAEKLRTIEEQLAKEAAKREKLEHELNKERERAELEKYKQVLLRDAGNDIIPELVRGDSRDELNNSIAYAKSRFQELFQASAGAAEGNKRKQVTDNMPGPTNPDDDALEERELQSNVANFEIDADRYYRDRAYRAEIDKKRAAIADKISSAYKAGRR